MRAAQQQPLGPRASATTSSKKTAKKWAFFVEGEGRTKILKAGENRKVFSSFGGLFAGGAGAGLSSDPPVRQAEKEAQKLNTTALGVPQAAAQGMEKEWVAFGPGAWPTKYAVQAAVGSHSTGCAFTEPMLWLRNSSRA